MSYLLGNPAHQCYVYPDFEKAIERFTSAGIGPFFVLNEVGVNCHYRGRQLADDLLGLVLPSHSMPPLWSRL
jgi:hypothetical protein